MLWPAAGLTPRMAAKAFRHAGTTVASELRTRRLAGASEDLRAAALADASIGGIAARVRGSGKGLGVHLLTGPVHIEDAEPGDMEVRILDVRPRPCCHPRFRGRAFGINAAASWGLQYCELVEPPTPREVITVFELDAR